MEIYVLYPTIALHNDMFTCEHKYFFKGVFSSKWVSQIHIVVQVFVSL